MNISIREFGPRDAKATLAQTFIVDRALQQDQEGAEVTHSCPPWQATERVPHWLNERARNPLWNLRNLLNKKICDGIFPSQVNIPSPSPSSMKIDMGVQWNLILMHLLDTAGHSYNDLRVKRVMALFCYI
jgi:hypothetical protein